MKNTTDFWRDYVVPELPNVPDFLNPTQIIIWNLEHRFYRDPWIKLLHETLSNQLAILIRGKSIEENKLAIIETFNTILCVRYLIKEKSEANYFQQYVNFMKTHGMQNETLYNLAQAFIDSLSERLEVKSDWDNKIITQGSLALENIGVVFGSTDIVIDDSDNIVDIAKISRFVSNLDNQPVHYCISSIQRILSYLNCLQSMSAKRQLWREFETKSATS